jgi:hypothetical protein
MTVTARLALFAAGFVLAVAAGWSVGRLVSPYWFPSTPELAAKFHPHSGAPHATPSPEEP